MKNILPIALGAIIGALSRYYLTEISTRFNIPYADLFIIAFINLLGSLMIGIVVALPVHSFVNLFLTVGFLGSFTTFSSFTSSFFKLAESSFLLSLVYLLISVCGSFILFFLAKLLTTKILLILK